MKKNLAAILITIATALGLGGIVRGGLELHTLRASQDAAAVCPQASDAQAFALATAATGTALAADATATGAKW